MRLQHKKVIVISLSGVAATILIDGITGHSTFKNPVDIRSISTCNLPAESELTSTLLEADVIIWDEIVMVHKKCLEAVDRQLQDIFQNTLTVCGKQRFYLQKFVRSFQLYLLVEIIK